MSASTIKHPFLDPEQHEKLKVFARLLHEQGGMKAITDDGEIVLRMAMCGVKPPSLLNSDTHSVILFSDKELSYLVVKYNGFGPEGDGYACLCLKRDYLMAQFCPNGTFSPSRAKKITDGMLAIMLVDPRKVSFDYDSLKPAPRIVL